MATISGTTINTGITLGTSGNYASPLTITATGAVEASSGNAVTGPGTQPWTVVNQGTLTAPGYGVRLFDGGYVGNAGGLIQGILGIYASAAAGTVTNSGTILGTLGIGVFLKGGGSVGNNAGLIEGVRGVQIAGSAGSVTNSATIVGTNGDGVYLQAGGSVANNAGLIEGSTGVDITGGAGTVTNYSTIIGTSGVGVALAAGGTIVDSGTISGGAGTAVRFDGTGGNLLVLDPGYHLGGVVVGGTSAGATNTLELGSAASAGTVSAALPTEFVNFGTVTVDAGAQWTLSANNTIGTGVTLSVAGTLTDLGTLTNAGSIDGTGSLVIDPASLFNSGYIGLAVTLSGGGYLYNEAPGTIAVAGTAVYGTLLAATIVNDGTIAGTGTGGIGVELAAGGTITNSGTIVSAATNAIYIKLAAGTITNTGLIENLTTAHPGIYLQAGGLITNATGATITSERSAIRFADTLGTTVSFGTVINSGTIQSTGVTAGSGIYLGQGGIVTNQTSGLITAIRNAAQIVDVAATIVNLGVIENSGTNAAIYSRGGGMITNAAGATIESTNRTAIAFNDTVGTAVSFGTIDNSGTIESNAITAGVGVYFAQGGILTNEAGATIEAVRNGVVIVGIAATIANFGIIENTGSNSTIYSRGGGLITNAAGATIEDLGTGTAIAFNDTVGTTVSFGTVDNSGTIESTGTTSGVGVYFGQGGILTNQTAGLITAHRQAISAAHDPATVVNYGMIENAGGGTAASSVILFSAGGTVTNHGVILQNQTANSGVSISGSAGRITNYGTIAATNSGTAGTVNANGIFLGAGGTISNLGTLSAAADSGEGVAFGAAGGTLVNGTAGSSEGLITAYHIGVGFFVGTAGSTGAVTITNYGTIQSTQLNNATATGFSGAGVQMGTSATGVVSNFGTISAAQTNGGWAILLQAGGQVTNSGTGLITAPIRRSISTAAPARWSIPARSRKPGRRAPTPFSSVPAGRSPIRGRSARRRPTAPASA